MNILLKKASHVLTMNDGQEEMQDVDIRLSDGIITEIGPDLARGARRFRPPTALSRPAW